MHGKPIHLLCVGKLKLSFCKEGCALYVARLQQFRKLCITEVHDGEAKEAKLRNEQEGKLLLQSLPSSPYTIILDEQGKPLNSLELSALLQNLNLQGKEPCFVLGGPYGLSPKVKAQGNLCFSLSNLTLPHELARLLLLEQLYRAECITRRIPYHH